MNTQRNIDQIIVAVKKLPRKEQLTLRDKLDGLINDNKKEVKETKLSDLSGLGAELWAGMNVGQHLDEAREW